MKIATDSPRARALTLLPPCPAISLSTPPPHARLYRCPYSVFCYCCASCFCRCNSVHDNVEDAGESVNQGHLALLNTMRSLSSNRRLVLSVSGVLLLFLLFFFVFLV